jgi:hypothetical protein
MTVIASPVTRAYTHSRSPVITTSTPRSTLPVAPPTFAKRIEEPLLTIRRTRWRSHLIRAAAAMLVAATITVPAFVRPAPAMASYGISQKQGIDACGLMNNLSKDQTFWTYTSYSTFGLYIGGSIASCPTSSASYVASLLAQGWRLLPIWVGPQAPCSSFGSRMSYDTATAFAQGKTEAHAAVQKEAALGMDTLNAPVIFDLEAYDTSNASCLAAVKSFITGWTTQLHIAPAQQSGVYGSGCGSGVGQFATLNPPPDFIDGADWDGASSTASISCVADGNWIFNQRHKQYRGGHNETYNGVTVAVDSDCSNGPVYGPSYLTSSRICY